jgi:hypothetical protein
MANAPRQAGFQNRISEVRIIIDLAIVKPQAR